MVKWQKVFLWILFALNAFITFVGCEEYYDNIINECRSWGPGGKCPWGAESMGVAWTSEQVYKYFVIQGTVQSLAAILFAIYFIRDEQPKIAVVFLLLPLILGWCTQIAGAFI